jgi:nicotinamide phosphoribosyltransferase
MARDGTLVIRPDSGDPIDVTLKVIEILGEKFGYTTNEKGYKVLDPHVRMIQGDGVNYNSIHDILQNFKDHGWSADNIAFGMGGALLQRLDRDSLKFAMKANEIVRDGTAHPVFKDPITDHGKVSKKGRQVVNEDQYGQIAVIPETAYRTGLERDPYNYHNLLKWKYIGSGGSPRHFGHCHWKEIVDRAAV